MRSPATISTRAHSEGRATAAVRPRCSPSATLQLQRLAGNRAVAGLVDAAAVPVVQRGKKDRVAKPTIADTDLAEITFMLSGLAPFEKDLKALAKKKQAVAELSLTYGLFELGWDDVNRLGAVAPKDKPSLTAMRALAQGLEGVPAAIAASEGAYDEKDLKKRLGKQATFFGAVATLAAQYRATYTKQPAGYEHQASVGASPLKAQDELKRTVLPTTAVIARAPGPVGDALRALTGAGTEKQAIATNEVTQLYKAFTQAAWVYDVGASPSAHDLILRHTNTAVCGAFASALVELVNLVAKARDVPNPAILRSHLGRFVTKKYRWGYIDPAVMGNIESIEGGPTGYAKVKRAAFTSHTWMEAGGTTYDPLGKKKGVDFMDTDIGPLATGAGDVVATNDDWDLLKADNPPPAGFPQGYKLRKHV